MIALPHLLNFVPDHSRSLLFDDTLENTHKQGNSTKPHKMQETGGNAQIRRVRAELYRQTETI